MNPGNEVRAVLMGWVDHKDRFCDATIELDVTPDRSHPKNYRPVAILIMHDKSFWQAAMGITQWVDTEPQLKWVRKAPAYREQTTFVKMQRVGGGSPSLAAAWCLLQESLLMLRRHRTGT